MVQIVYYAILRLMKYLDIKIAVRIDQKLNYLNLLIAKGRLEAYKNGRNWLSSEEAVKRYIESRERKRINYTLNRK